MSDAITKVPQVKTDIDNLTTSIQNNGGQSAATGNDRAQLIADLEKAGVNASTAKTDVDNFITSIGNIPKSVSLSITENATGTVAITAPGTAAVQGGGHMVGPATGMAGGGLVTRGAGPTADDVMIMASRGEVVVPAHMVSAGAVDHLRGQLPGFAGGGYVGPLTGLGAWTGTQYTSLVTSLAGALEEALQSAMSSTVSGGTRSPVTVNFLGTQMPTAEQRQAIMTELSALVGVS